MELGMQVWSMLLWVNHHSLPPVSICALHSNAFKLLAPLLLSATPFQVGYPVLITCPMKTLLTIHLIFFTSSSLLPYASLADCLYKRNGQLYQLHRIQQGICHCLVCQAVLKCLEDQLSCTWLISLLA